MNIRGYIRQLADHYKGHVSAAGRLRGPTNIWTHLSDPRSSIFVGDVLPMNVTRYIHWFYIIDEYIVTFIGTDE
jgi:hypothetical protein